MTKEKLIYDLREKYEVKYLFDKLDEFFASNVCIPKGKNRHPYADVYHLMLEEGHSLEPSQDTGWYAFKTYIKPSEPVYEWQYVFYDKDKEIARSSFLTEHEYDISCLSFEWLMDVKSKRVRQ